MLLNSEEANWLIKFNNFVEYTKNDIITTKTYLYLKYNINGIKSKTQKT